MKTRDMCLVAMMTALMCAVAPVTVPIGPVPLSLATLVVYLSGAVLGLRRGTMAVTLYILIGAMGMPVYSGFTGGIQRLAGPTGGYIAGYALCAAIVGFAADARKGKKMIPAAMLLGTIACYVLGTVWFMAQAGTGIAGALTICVLPFLPGDAVKIAAASSLAGILRKRIRR